MKKRKYHEITEPDEDFVMISTSSHPKTLPEDTQPRGRGRPPKIKKIKANTPVKQLPPKKLRYVDTSSESSFNQSDAESEQCELSIRDQILKDYEVYKYS